MLLIGNWSDPKPCNAPDEIQVLQQVIESKNCTCQFCGTVTRLTSQTPLGFFDVCLGDRSLPDEPKNWVVLCKVCSDLNSLSKLKGKGSFIEAPWIKQGELTNLLRLSYAIAVRPDNDWGVLKNASEAFLNAIDSAPEGWAGINWDGSVEGLEAARTRLVHPFTQSAYANQLRFRYNLEPYEEAIRYWAVNLEQLVNEESNVESENAA